MYFGKKCTESKSRHYCNLPDSEADDSFGVNDGEPLNEGTVTVGPKFGCIHHATT